MPRFARMLMAFDSTPAADPPEAAVKFHQSNLIMILAALLCALICILGLFMVARCAWFRRRRRSSVSSPSPSPDPSANKGLKKKILNSLPKFTYGSAAAATGGDGSCCKFELTECAICLGEFSKGDVVRVLPQCGHGFHVGCIDKWLESHSSCPSCRQILVLVVATCRKCGQFPKVSLSSSSSSSSGCGELVVADCQQPCKDNNHNNNNKIHLGKSQK